MALIDTLFNLGDDALGYEYQVTFGPMPYLDVAEGLTMRINTCEIPAHSIGEYEYKYKSETVKKPNGQIETTKEFSIEFRVDKYYALYKAFVAWNNGITNPVTGGASFDNVGGISNIRIPITVATGTYDISGNFVPTLQVWNFIGCWPREVASISLDNSSGEPVMCSITFSYLSLQ